MDADQELPDDELPLGLTPPIWIEAPRNATQVEILGQLADVVGEHSDVMVLYWKSEEEASVWCRDKCWQYHNAGNITGCEARCVVLLNCHPHSERITRGINKLIIVTK